MRRLDPHQRKAGLFIRKKSGCAGIFMAPGTGKTLVAIRYGRILEGKKLIICRRDDFLTWRNELIEDGVKKTSICEIESSSNIHCISDHYEWVMVTYDLVKNLRVYSYLVSTAWCLVIADEVHSIKRSQTKRTRYCIKATRHIERRLALTGSPITNEIADVWSQGFWIDNGETFGRNFWQFRAKHYNKSGPGWYPRKKSKKLISEKLDEIAFYVHEDDVLKLPPTRPVMKGCKMHKDQAKLYEQILRTWEYEVANGATIEIDHVIVQIAKLRQITSGFIYEKVDDKVVNTRWMKSSKIDLLKRTLGDDLESREKVVIACAHTAEIKKIAEVLGKDAVTFYGEMSRKDRMNARLRFKNSINCKYFVANVDMLVGMNELIVARDLVYFTNSRKVVSRQQADRRIRRRGSEHHKVITYWDLVCEGTIDEKIVRGVKTKVDIASEILRSLKSGKSVRESIQ